MDTWCRKRNCVKCGGELVNENGVHLGVPFAHWHVSRSISPMAPLIVCTKCYDVLTTDLDTKIQRTGEETI
jgi:hypothetical protein